MAKAWAMDGAIVLDAFADAMIDDVKGAAELLSLLPSETLEDVLRAADDFKKAVDLAVQGRLNRARRAVM